jgi:pilus assembly protein Flp/PilA
MHVGNRIERGEEMAQFVTSVKKFLVSEDGPTAVEYAVMLALIVIVCLTAIQAIGTNANAKFQAAADALQ